jgi:transcriptional regulator with XRE-family HTH domain
LQRVENVEGTMKMQERREFLDKLGAAIRKLRITKGFGQDALTREAGLAKGTVSKIENGTVDPKVTTLARLSRALEVPLARIVAVVS